MLNYFLRSNDYFVYLRYYFNIENLILRPSGLNTALCAPQRPGLTAPFFPHDMNTNNNGDNVGICIANRGYQAPIDDNHLVALTTQKLQLVINNDKEVARFGLFFADFTINIWAGQATRVGDAICNSIRLRRLGIYDVMAIDNDNGHNTHFDWLRNFFRRLARNRLIEYFSLGSIQFPWNPFDILYPFFKHNHNLQCIKLDDVDLLVYFPSFLSTL